MQTTQSGDPQRAKYYIGQNIGISRTVLESVSQAIITRLVTDTLPGMTPAAVAALKTARDAYLAVQTAQSGDQSGATTSRSQLEAKVKEVADKRRQTPIRRRRHLAGDEEGQRRRAHGVQDPAQPRAEVSENRGVNHARGCR